MHVVRREITAAHQKSSSPVGLAIVQLQARAHLACWSEQDSFPRLEVELIDAILERNDRPAKLPERHGADRLLQIKASG